MASIPPVGSNSVNTANGSFEKAMQGDNSVGVATSGGGKGGISGDLSSTGPDKASRPSGTGDFQDTSRYQIDQDIFE